MEWLDAPPAPVARHKRTSRYMQERQQYRNRPRKILNLEERVQAIHLYESNPIYQRVASVFKCSWEQIKNVVQNRDSILQYYAMCQTINDTDNPRLVRQKKINFLGKVMYEYIKRAHFHHRGLLNDEIIRTQALEFRNIIQIESFYPNKAWITDFKHAYNLDLAHLDTIVMTQEPAKSLDARDIVAFCSKELELTHQIQQKWARRDESPTTPRTKPLETINLVEDADDYRDPDQIHPPDVAATEKRTENVATMDFVDAYDEADDINEDEEGPTINYGEFEFGVDEDGDGDNDEDDIETVCLDEPDQRGLASTMAMPETTTKITQLLKTEPPSYNEGNLRSESEATTEQHAEKTSPQRVITEEESKESPRILSYAAALKLLEPLEEFALLEEDFAAVNLVSQLMDTYRRGLKRQRNST